MIKKQSPASKRLQTANISPHRIIRTVLVLAVLVLLASCSNPKDFVSTSEPRLDTPPMVDYLQWKTGFRRWSMYGGVETSSASGLIRDLAGYSRFLPFPMVMWAADAERRSSIFEYPDHQPYAEAFRRIGAWAGPYTAYVQPGFIEVVWADNKKEKRIRDAMGDRVPPIVFRSRNAADFLFMWHAISRMDFKYDPAILEASNAYDRTRLLEESDPDLSLADVSNQPFPLGFTQFVSTEELDIDDFMPLLAAHVGGSASKTLRGWVIEKFRRDQKGIQLIEDCLAKIKNDRFFRSSEPIEILSRIGLPALPELLREFRPIIIDQNIDRQIERMRGFDRPTTSYMGKLLRVLSRIPSRECDEALLSALKNKTHDNSRAVVEALATAKCRMAEPLIRQIATDSQTSPEVRMIARLALNSLGQPLASADPEREIAAASSVRSQVETGKGRQAMILLRTVLNQCNQYKAGMQVQTADLENPKSIVLWGHYGEHSMRAYRGTWTFEIPVMLEDRALVRFSFACGKFCSEGYLAWLKKQDGRWLVVKWQQEWMS